MRTGNTIRIAPIQQEVWPNTYMQEIIETNNPHYQIIALNEPSVIEQQRMVSPPSSELVHYGLSSVGNTETSKATNIPKQTSSRNIIMIIAGISFGILIRVALGLSLYAVVSMAQTTIATTTKATITTTSTTTTGSFPHQCSVYTVYNDATRHVSPAGGSTCDQTIFSTTFSTWVRFIGIGGTEIPRSATNASRCGTSYTGWYMGTMPTTSMTVVGTVCYASTTSDCFIFNSIVVTNCESFYVYGLIDPPVCNSRYCII